MPELQMIRALFPVGGFVVDESAIVVPRDVEGDVEVGGDLAGHGRDVTEDDLGVDRRQDDLRPDHDLEPGVAGDGAGLVRPRAGVLSAVGGADLGDEHAAVLQDLDAAGERDLSVWSEQEL